MASAEACQLVGTHESSCRRRVTLIAPSLVRRSVLAHGEFRIRDHRAARFEDLSDDRRHRLAWDSALRASRGRTRPAPPGPLRGWRVQPDGHSMRQADRSHRRKHCGKPWSSYGAANALVAPGQRPVVRLPRDRFEGLQSLNLNYDAALAPAHPFRELSFTIEACARRSPSGRPRDTLGPDHSNHQQAPAARL